MKVIKEIVKGVIICTVISFVCSLNATAQVKEKESEMQETTECPMPMGMMSMMGGMMPMGMPMTGGMMPMMCCPMPMGMPMGAMPMMGSMMPMGMGSMMPMGMMHMMGGMMPMMEMCQKMMEKMSPEDRKQMMEMCHQMMTKQLEHQKSMMDMCQKMMDLMHKTMMGPTTK